MTTYSFLFKNGNWIIYRDDANGRVEIGTLQGRRISLAIPCQDYMTKHGVDLSQVFTREVRNRPGSLPSAWKVFEFTHKS